MTDSTHTRAQRAARIRAIEGVPDEECVVEMGYEPTDCDCGICDHHQPEEPTPCPTRSRSAKEALVVPVRDERTKKPVHA